MASDGQELVDGWLLCEDCAPLGFHMCSDCTKVEDTPLKPYDLKRRDGGDDSPSSKRRDSALPFASNVNVTSLDHATTLNAIKDSPQQLRRTSYSLHSDSGTRTPAARACELSAAGSGVVVTAVDLAATKSAYPKCVDPWRHPFPRTILPPY